MKILCIQPAFLDVEGHVTKYPGRRGKAVPLSLLHLAGLTPPDVEVAWVDDLFEPVPMDTDADMIALTTMTGQAPRAYQLADAFRERGKTVVMGGHHVTLEPDDARPHADALVIGEAENVWEPLLDDARSGRLHDTYQSDAWHSLKGLPTPRYDLLASKKQKYALYSIQTTRGCPRTCNFCSINTFFEHTYRMRPVEDVVRDVAAVKKTGNRIFFVDDNLFINKDYCRELFNALIPLKVHWMSQGEITLAEDPELLDLAVRAGCYSLYIGIETISKKNIEQINKWFNKVEDYERNFNTIRRHGISVFASIMFGLDGDDEEVFRDTLDFLLRTKTAAAAMYIFTPVPGTELSDRVRDEGRLLTTDYRHYTGSEVVVEPKNMTALELEHSFWEVYKKFYSWPAIARRFAFYPTNKLAYAVALMENIVYRRDILRRCHPFSGGFRLFNRA